MAPVGIAHASSLYVEPAIHNIEGIRREEFRYHVTITNRGPGMETIFPVVAEIDAETGKLFRPGGPGDGHQMSSTWVEMPRKAIYLDAGGSKEIPVKVQMNPHARVGTYHHIIAFVPGTHPEVSGTVIESAPRVLVNLRVNEDAVERLNLVSFGTVRRILFGFPAVLRAEILNGGNRDLAPSGRVRILDRNDREVGELVFNASGTVVPEGADASMDTRWNGNGFGRFKAVLEMHYGEHTKATVADGTLFWIIPPWLIGAVVGAAILLVFLLTHAVHRKVSHHADR